MDERFASLEDTRGIVELGEHNEVRLWLSVIAYKLGNPWRRLVLPKETDN